MSNPLHTANSSHGLTLKAYRGDGACLLAMNLEDHLAEDLAGFAIQRTSPDGTTAMLMNRLNFKTGYTATLTAKQRKWWPTNEAPYQKFWWVDFPPLNLKGEYRYEVTTMRFVDERRFTADQRLDISLPLGPFESGLTEMGFTRGYLSSQAYHDRFKNRAFQPKKKSIDFDTKPFASQYKWLGFHARQMIFDFLEECLKTPKSQLDVFAYDLNEPDVIHLLGRFGKRLRMVLDNAALHHGKGKLEDQAEKFLRQKGCKIIRGHFGRYSHDKVLIKKDARGSAVKVLTGSTNFSVTGLYVNANNVLIFNEKSVAELYENAFDLVFRTEASKSEFVKSKFAKQEFEFSVSGLPHMFISFAPHKKPTSSLNRLKDELQRKMGLKGADSSVLFAIMGLRGGGEVLKRLREIHADPEIFSYGVCDDTEELKPTGDVEVFTPTKKTGALVKSAVLRRNIPRPFSAEATGAGAHKIHHKFVVIDFNDSDPVLFVGSSNLANGGEENNGDNLLAIYDREMASVFAIEAIRLVDHYSFRAAVTKATKADPLDLKTRSEKWWKPYYDKNSMKYRERLLFAR